MAMFDAGMIAQQVSERMVGRLDSLGMNAHEYEENTDILNEFNKIASGMLQEDPTIEMPGGQPVEMDERIALQAVSLFSEGIFFAMSKCLEMGIVGDVKKQLLQNLAMDIFTQCRQVCASTYGQEATPEFQFSFEQQVDIIHQGAESYLMFYINEHEKQFGPIEIQEPTPRLLQKMEKVKAEDADAMADPLLSTPPAPASTARPQGPTPHDKYGAVALLLSALPPDQRGRILQNFNADEKELITFYSYPQHIEQNLDMECVNTHLQRFKEMLKQGGPNLKSAAFQGVARLAESNPVEKLLSYVKDERPAVKRYIEAHYGIRDGEPLEGAPGSNRHFAEHLPGRIEDILYRYLSKRVDALG